MTAMSEKEDTDEVWEGSMPRWKSNKFSERCLQRSRERSRKRLKMKSKPNALACPEAQLKIYPFRARPPLTQGRQEAKYCTPLGDLSFSTDQ